MPRLHMTDPTKATGRVKEIFEGPLKGKTFNIFKTMAASPAALDAYLGLSGALNKASLNPKEREAIQLALGQANDCGYCVAAHTAIGTMCGMTTDQTLEARRGRMADSKMGALVRFALTLNEKRGHVADADVAAVRAAGYDDGQIAEIIATVALAIYTNWFNHVAQTPTDFPAPPAI